MSGVQMSGVQMSGVPDVGGPDVGGPNVRFPLSDIAATQPKGISLSHYKYEFTSNYVHVYSNIFALLCLITFGKFDNIVACKLLALTMHTMNILPQ